MRSLQRELSQIGRSMPLPSIVCSCTSSVSSQLHLLPILPSNAYILMHCRAMRPAVGTASAKGMESSTNPESRLRPASGHASASERPAGMILTAAVLLFAHARGAIKWIRSEAKAYFWNCQLHRMPLYLEVTQEISGDIPVQTGLHACILGGFLYSNAFMCACCCC